MSDWQTEFHKYQEILNQWPENSLKMSACPAEEGYKVVSFYNDDTVVMEVLVRPDNRVVKVLQPIILLN